MYVLHVYDVCMQVVREKVHVELIIREGRLILHVACRSLIFFFYEMNFTFNIRKNVSYVLST